MVYCWDCFAGAMRVGTERGRASHFRHALIRKLLHRCMAAHPSSPLRTDRHRLQARSSPAVSPSPRWTRLVADTSRLPSRLLPGPRRPQSTRLQRWRWSSSPPVGCSRLQRQQRCLPLRFQTSRWTRCVQSNILQLLPNGCHAVVVFMHSLEQSDCTLHPCTTHSTVLGGICFNTPAVLLTEKSEVVAHSGKREGHVAIATMIRHPFEGCDATPALKAHSEGLLLT